MHIGGVVDQVAQPDNIVTADSCYWDDLKSVAPAFGYTPDDIDALAAEGFSPEELEDFLYCGEI